MDAIAALENLSRQLAGRTKLCRLGEMAVSAIQGHLHKEPFTPLSPATVDYRRAGRPLEDSGRLLSSITYQVEPGETSKVAVGTPLKYAAVQNNGATIKARKKYLWIPARGTRTLQRRYGWTITAVLNGLKGSGYSVFRMGRTVCYRPKGGKKEDTVTVYYLKEQVVIPPRPFFYLTEEEIDHMLAEVFG